MDNPAFAPLTIAQEISKILSARLKPFDARTVTLSRDEALLTLGLVDSVVDWLEKEQDRQHP